jgi:hypothetical protein
MTVTDPFDRAVDKEAQLRRRFDLTDGDAMVRVMSVLTLAIVIGWGAVVLGHYLIAGPGNVVFQVHAVVFAVTSVVMVMMVVAIWFLNRRGIIDGNRPPPT